MENNYYFGIKDVVANAMIEILAEKQEKGKDINTPLIVSLKDLEEYGDAVVSYIDKTFNKKAILLLSRESTEYMFENYSDFFEEINQQDTAVKLKENISIEDLIEHFRMYISFYILEAFMSDEAKAILLQKYAK